jgi:N-acetyl-gamma-glutamylphosphate reductase
MSLYLALLIAINCYGTHPFCAIKSCLYGSKQRKHAHECHTHIDNTTKVTQPAFCRTVLEHFSGLVTAFLLIREKSTVSKTALEPSK